jgi:hypothetical protein
MSLRVEVSLFVARPRRSRGWQLGEAQKDLLKKSDMNSFIFFCCSYSKMTIFKLAFAFLVVFLIGII